jgi:hypothetical protein
MGLLDMLNTPAGIGLLSAAAGAMAGARRGQPWNTAGRGALAGLTGYAQANDQIRVDKEKQIADQMRQMQMDEILRKRSDQDAYRAQFKPAGQTAFKPDDPFNEGAATFGQDNLKTETPPMFAGQAIDPKLAAIAPFLDPKEMYSAMKPPEKPKPIALGKTLVNPETGETIAVDSTWKDDQIAQREQRAKELELRLEDQRLSREQQMALRRELAGQQEALRRDLAAQASAARQQPTAKPMTAAQEAKYRDSLAGDYQAANTNLSNMNDVLTSIKAVRTAPGLDRATGIQAYLPSYPDGKAAAAEVRLKNLEGKITQLGKAAAAQGGAIGPMAVQEWKIVRDMIAAVDPKKGKQPLLDQIDLIENSVIGASARIKDAYHKQYGADFENYPQFAELRDPAKAPATDKKAAFNEYLDAYKRAKTPEQRKAITDRARKLGVVK